MKITFTFIFSLLLFLIGCSSNSSTTDYETLQQKNMELKEELGQVIEKNGTLMKENAKVIAYNESLMNQNTGERDNTRNEIRRVHVYSDEMLKEISRFKDQKETVTAHFTLDGNTYIFLKSTESLNTGIDFDGVAIQENLLQVFYETFDYHDKKNGLSQEVLLQVIGEYHQIEVIQSYSTEQ